MGISKLDKTILEAVKKLKNDQTIKNKDIMEWSSAPITEKHEGEEAFIVPELGIYVSLKIKR